MEFVIGTDRKAICEYIESHHSKRIIFVPIREDDFLFNVKVDRWTRLGHFTGGVTLELEFPSNGPFPHLLVEISKDPWTRYRVLQAFDRIVAAGVKFAKRQRAVAKLRKMVVARMRVPGFVASLHRHAEKERILFDYECMKLADIKYWKNWIKALDIPQVVAQDEVETVGKCKNVVQVLHEEEILGFDTEVRFAVGL